MYHSNRFAFHLLVKYFTQNRQCSSLKYHWGWRGVRFLRLQVKPLLKLIANVLFPVKLGYMTIIHSGLERTRGKHVIFVSGLTYGDWRLTFSTHVNIFSIENEIFNIWDPHFVNPATEKTGQCHSVCYDLAV